MGITPHVISASEYEERRHALELCSWINKKLEAFEKSGVFDALYIERKGAGLDNPAKKIVEEAIPLSRLALNLSQPGIEVFVTLHHGNQPFDATFSVEGFMKGSARTFPVEVTSAMFAENHVRREVLAKRGYVSLIGPISRTKDGEIYEGEDLVNLNELEQKYIRLMFAALMKKLDKNYPEDVSILVFLQEFGTLSMYSRNRHIRQTRKHLNEHDIKRQVYYGYQFNNAIDPVAWYEL